MVKLNKAIILDRDGILNYALFSRKLNIVTPPYKLSDLKICYTNIKYLNLFKNDYFFFIITNQPDIKKGIQSREFNEYINTKILKLIKIKEIFTCFCHEKEIDCDCYKPKPKMIFDIKKKWNVDLQKSFVIGDRWRDIGAGKFAGCKTVFLKKNYNINDLTRIKPDYTVNNLKYLQKIIPLY